jgi:hypothetical protein
MKTNIRTLLTSFVVASVALMGTLGSARAADDKWFELGQTTIKSTDPSASIKSEGSRWDKDVKQVKLSIEGADVQITNVVLHWDNRKDDTLTNVGVVKSGGQTAAKDAPRSSAARRRPTSRSGDLTERPDTPGAAVPLPPS